MMSRPEIGLTVFNITHHDKMIRRLYKEYKGFMLMQQSKRVTKPKFKLQSDLGLLQDIFQNCIFYVKIAF